MAAQYLPLEEARAVVVKQGFKNQKDYYAWKGRPASIPGNPRNAYGSEWEGWAYWLGTGSKNARKPERDVVYLPFEEARDVARQFAAVHQIRRYADWTRWSKTPERPSNIPSDPAHVYKDKGWNGWPDWLGEKSSTAPVAKKIRSFTAAREYVRSLGLGSSKAWFDWAATAARPLDIPNSPDKRYRDDGWIGWGNFLGFDGRWNHLSIVAFLESLKPVIETLTELDLYLILSKKGLLSRDSRVLGNRILRPLTRLKRPEDIDAAKDELANEFESEGEDASAERVSFVENLDPKAFSKLNPLAILRDLSTVDVVKAARITEDPEILDFMVTERVSILWVKAMEDGVDAAWACIPDIVGEYVRLIRDRFETELTAVQRIPLPAGYDFHGPDGDFRKPNLMQRLTAWRLLHEKRVGNWSGVGAGKTAAAIFSAGVVDARLVVVVAANATLEGWQKAVHQVFPTGTHVHCGKARTFKAKPELRNFLIVNYETFQQEWTEEFINMLLDAQKIDLIILDEVHLARQRFENEVSTRREFVARLIDGAIAKNPDLRILAMAATPVVNNLREAVKLLALIHPEKDFSGVALDSTVANAARVHLLLRQYGFRWVPNYEKSEGSTQSRTTPTIYAERLLPRLLEIKPRDLLVLEQTLLAAKLEKLGDWICRGTLIFTYYVTGIVDELVAKTESCKLKAEVFTGESKKKNLDSFIERYKRKEVDVLIGSAPIGTGVDGLQHYLNRLLFITLPWSNAEYQQIVGRLYRQGRGARPVEIIIPQVTVREERAGIWSWDDLRLKLIEHKRTLADAAVDGMIPTDGLPSRKEMQRRSLKALQDWMGHVRKGIEPTQTAESAESKEQLKG